MTAKQIITGLSLMRQSEVDIPTKQLLAEAIDYIAQIEQEKKE